MATRLIPSAAPSIHRPESLAIPSVLEIAPGGAREHFHLDTQPGEAQSSPPASLPPSFRSHLDASLGLDGDLRRSGIVDVAVTNSPVVTTINTDSKMDSTSTESRATRSSPSSGPDEILEPASVTAHRRERNGWRARVRARLNL
ncbi:hypothetical protein GSI_08540 [Ganoderma sinense ZZ0214-1]|uniref:Uncharacterized protein n=1 Tax=Ganoderma sinense ZZ0214-1 TaxID=1077348 RepID=A0A2G8S408_9APHY|nr:hypothetical protein GSI_08540 [Ganoderma sinense ZZ0214-1]